MTERLVLVGDNFTLMTMIAKRLIHKDDSMHVYRMTYAVPVSLDKGGFSYYRKIEVYYPGSLLKMRAKP